MVGRGSNLTPDCRHVTGFSKVLKDLASMPGGEYNGEESQGIRGALIYPP
jgi:hypothetical protein